LISLFLLFPALLRSQTADKFVSAKLDARKYEECATQLQFKERARISLAGLSFLSFPSSSSFQFLRSFLFSSSLPFLSPALPGFLTEQRVIATQNYRIDILQKIEEMLSSLADVSIAPTQSQIDDWNKEYQQAKAEYEESVSSLSREQKNVAGKWRYDPTQLKKVYAKSMNQLSAELRSVSVSSRSLRSPLSFLILFFSFIPFQPALTSAQLSATAKDFENVCLDYAKTRDGHIKTLTTLRPQAMLYITCRGSEERKSSTAYVMPSIASEFSLTSKTTEEMTNCLDEKSAQGFLTAADKAIDVYEGLRLVLAAFLVSFL
jgi:hypothetical protein